MKHRLILAIFVMVACVAAWGCGGGDTSAIDNAPSAKPQDLGDPNNIAMGVTEWKGTHFIVKAEVDGEVRVWVLAKRIRGPEGGNVRWIASENIFADNNRNHRYDISGLALHKVKSAQAGDNVGLPGLRLHRYKVELDPDTGHVLLYSYQALLIPEEDLSKPDTGAYVVVP